jgi:SAM-dependent methyltransferase
MTLNFVCCNVCGSSSYKILADVSFVIEGLQIVQCDQCEFEFVNPQPSPNDLDSLYDEPYFQGGYVPFSEIRIAKFRKRVAMLERFVTGGKVLDIGCGPGFFLAALDKDRWEKCGLDRSAFAVEYARKQLGPDAEIYLGDLGEVALKANDFDVATMFDVIGHVSDPKKYLQVVQEVLKPAGWLLIQLPNFHSPWHRFNQYLSMRHRVNRLHLPTIVNRFTLPVLTRFLRTMGFEVVKTVGFNLPNLGKAGWKLKSIKRLADWSGVVLSQQQEYLVFAQKISR